jgi:hypothetical protein
MGSIDDDKSGGITHKEFAGMIEELLLERRKGPNTVPAISLSSESFVLEGERKDMEEGRSGRRRSVRPARRPSSVPARESANMAEGEPQVSGRTVEAGQDALERATKPESATTFRGNEGHGSKSVNGTVEIKETSPGPEIDLEPEAAAVENVSTWQQRLGLTSANLNRIFPPERSLFCLTPESRIRQVCTDALAFPASWPESKRFFDNLILICIIMSSVTLAFENPRIGSNRFPCITAILK